MPSIFIVSFKSLLIETCTTKHHNQALQTVYTQVKGVEWALWPGFVPCYSWAHGRPSCYANFVFYENHDEVKYLIIVVNIQENLWEMKHLLPRRMLQLSQCLILIESGTFPYLLLLYDRFWCLDKSKNSNLKNWSTLLW